MGCDIHMNVEVRRNGRWHFVEPPIVHEEWNSNPAGRKTWWDDRSYITFSVLTGVRADEGDPAPISEPRGYPEDTDPVLRKRGRGQDHGDHSHSWLTLDEIFAYDWDVEFQEHGVVSMREYVRCLTERDTPKSWSRWVGGARTKVLTPEQADEWLKTDEANVKLLDEAVNAEARDEGFYLGQFVDWSWECRLSDRCASFLAWARSLPDMLTAAPADIRLVFSFDS